MQKTPILRPLHLHQMSRPRPPKLPYLLPPHLPPGRLSSPKRRTAPRPTLTTWTMARKVWWLTSCPARGSLRPLTSGWIARWCWWTASKRWWAERSWTAWISLGCVASTLLVFIVYSWFFSRERERENNHFHSLFFTAVFFCRVVPSLPAILT